MAEVTNAMRDPFHTMARYKIECRQPIPALNVCYATGMGQPL